MLLRIVAGLSIVFAHAPADEVSRRQAATVYPPYPNTPLTDGFLDYVIGNTTFQGYYAYPSSSTPLPGILVAHQYMGLGDTEYFRAREMASRGYVAFAMDSYGKGVRAANSTQARQLLSALQSNPTLYTSRILGGFDVLKTLPRRVQGAPAVNTSQLFAIGYCAGGGVVFELARNDVDGLLAVAGFHPVLTPLYNTSTSYPRTLRATVQAHHAQYDSAGDAGLMAFEAEMTRRNVSHWSTHKYGNCQHGWTDPSSSIYRAQEAEEAHANMRQLFGHLVGRNPDFNSWPPAPSAGDLALGGKRAKAAKGKMVSGKVVTPTTRFG